MHRVLRNKFVADPMDGSNKNWIVRIILDFLSQSRDAIVDGAATEARPFWPCRAD
jgi:hypothetical protein